jgi:flagellar biosynthesis protein
MPMRRKPTALKEAVALAYRDGAPAPKVVAKGRGLVAEAIIERAQEAGVYVHDSPELVSLLMMVDLDRHIPAELYRAVAELLAFLHLLERQALAERQGEALPEGLPVLSPLVGEQPLSVRPKAVGTQAEPER